MWSCCITLVITFTFTLTEASYESDVIHNGLFNAEAKVEGQDVATWCTISEAEQGKCEKLARAVLQDKGLFKQDFIEIQCKRAFDTEECMTWLDQGVASLLALDAGEVYIAGRYHSLIPIAQELYNTGEPYQYSIAVVKKGTLPQITPGGGLHGLRGVKGCFPNVGALAGWVMPIHILMQTGGLKVTDCNNHIKSAIHYFGESCAPNSLKDMYNPIGDNSDKLCKLCAGGGPKRCTLADPFAGYEGALKCLISNSSGEIAFVRDTTVQHALLSGKVFGGVSEEDFELLCRDGSRRPVRGAETCNWGKVPADAVVTSSAYSKMQRTRFQNMLHKIVELYGEPNPYNKQSNQTGPTAAPSTFRDIYNSDPFNPYGTTEQPRSQYGGDYNSRDRSRNYQGRDESVTSTVSPFRPRTDANGQPIELPFQLFRSNMTTDLLLQDATISFRLLREEDQAASAILRSSLVGSQAEEAVAGIRECPVKRAALCVTSDAEMDKCIKMRVALQAASLSPALRCVRAHSERHCERAVADGTADLLVLDSADMLHAAHRHQLVPFMQEVYSNGETWYYAVAVAKEQDPDTELTYLRGKRTCHTGVGLAAGWVYPLAYLLSNGWIRSYWCDGAHAASEYFSASCAPGALSSEYVDGRSEPRHNLCHLCHGAAFRRCRRDASEDYFGSLGALRCMVEGGGDVAFVPHWAPAAAAAGRRREYWARDLLPDDLQLLCPDGTRAKIEEFERCNLGAVPGGVVAGRANHTELDAYRDLLTYAQALYGPTANDDFSFSMFESAPPHADLIFRSAAVRLQPLPRHQRSAAIIAGSALPRAARLVACDAPPSAAALAADPAFLSAAARPRAALVAALVAALGAALLAAPALLL